MSQKAENKMLVKRHHENTGTKKAGITTLISHKIDFKRKNYYKWKLLKSNKKKKILRKNITTHYQSIYTPN